MTNKNPVIILKTKIRIISPFSGKSKFKFWSMLEVGDIVELSTQLKPIARGSHSGLYATTIHFNLVDPEAKRKKRNSEFGREAIWFSDSLTQSAKYLEKIEYELVEETTNSSTAGMKFEETVHYYHGSMYGTYLVPCEILEIISENKYKISFFDEVIKEQSERIVDKNDLQFSKDAKLL